MDALYNLPGTPNNEWYLNQSEKYLSLHFKKML